MRTSRLLLLCLLSTGCATASATHGSVSKDLATECVAHCKSLDMKLTAMVIIKNSAGCVCEPTDSQSRTVSAAAAVSGGAMLVEQEEQQANLEQQQAAQSSMGH